MTGYKVPLLSRGKGMTCDMTIYRSMGDQMLQPYLIADPYISVTDLTSSDEFLIIACDGVWDVTTDQEVMIL